MPQTRDARGRFVKSDPQPAPTPEPPQVTVTAWARRWYSAHRVDVWLYGIAAAASVALGWLVGSAGG